MPFWLFQANPKYSQIVPAIAELEQIHWLVTRYVSQIAPGDAVLIWIAGPKSGLYASAQVMESPQFLDAPPDLSYWTMPMRARVRWYSLVRFQQTWLDCPLLKLEVRHDPVLRSLEVLRAPHNTNFRVTPEQWAQVQRLRPFT